MKNKMGKKNGYTLIELLAVIVVLALLSTVAFVSISKVMGTAKERYYISLENNLEAVARDFASDNRNYLPKSIGGVKKIYLGTLKKANYIKDVIDYNKSDCFDDQTYVQVFKYAKGKYSYTTFLVCPTYSTSKDSNSIVYPMISELYFDNDVNPSNFNFKIEGGSVKLLSYTVRIYLDNKLDSSNTYMLDGNDSYSSKFSLSKYRGNTDNLKVELTVVNINGLATTKTLGKGLGYKVNYYVDGSKVSTIPLKTSGYEIDTNKGSGTGIECNNLATASWDNDNWNIYVSNITLPGTYCNVYFKEKNTLYNVLKNEAAKGTNACVKKYEGNVTDEVGKTVPATKVYFDNCPEQRNVIFGGFCWQVIRTTETGGTKMIYNGEPVNGKCLSTRNLHTGITSGNSKTTSLNDSYIYGSSYTYDLNNNTFTLIDTETATWSDSTYRNLMGKYTCKSSSNTCSTLYNINGYKSNTSAYVGEYNIGNTYYSQIGTTSFNPDYTSLSMIGYKYNYVYNYLEQQPGSPEYKYGSSFTYDINNNMYTLSGETQMVSNYSSNYRNIGNTHYTCWNTTGTCEKIYYIYYAGNWVMHDLIEAFYIELSNGESGPEAMNKMINNEDINKYDSSIKGLIDNWYNHNMINYTNSLEDTVYCNSRKSTSLGGWNPNSGSSNISNHIDFKAVVLNNKDISCERVLDQFAVSNKKAELKYPIALFSIEEYNNLDSNDLRKTGSQYWSMSPARFYMDGAYVRGVLPTGELHYNDYGDLFYSNGVRPAISLKYNKVITSGSGSEEDPWIIE